MPQDALAAVTALPGVFESVEAARGSVDRLLRELRGPELRRRVTEVTAESIRVAAWASSALEGREGALSEYVVPVEDPLGRNALRLHVEIGELAAVWAAAPGQALARMHVLAAADLVEESAWGRPATAEAAARLDALADLLARPTTAPAVVIAAIVHGEVLATDAFGPCTGLVARAASRCVLVSRGVDPRTATVPEAGHLEIGAHAYGEALEGYRSGAPDGVAQWVSHCAQAIALGGRIGRRIAADLGANRTIRQD